MNVEEKLTEIDHRLSEINSEIARLSSLKRKLTQAKEKLKDEKYLKKQNELESSDWSQGKISGHLFNWYLLPWLFQKSSHGPETSKRKLKVFSISISSGPWEDF